MSVNCDCEYVAFEDEFNEFKRYSANIQDIIDTYSCYRGDAIKSYLEDIKRQYYYAMMRGDNCITWEVCNHCRYSIINILRKDGFDVYETTGGRVVVFIHYPETI